MLKAELWRSIGVEELCFRIVSLQFYNLVIWTCDECVGCGGVLELYCAAHTLLEAYLCEATVTWF